MRSLFKHILCCIAVFAPGYSFSQPDPDSLIRLLKTDKEDTVKLKHLANLTIALFNIDPDTTEIITRSTLLLAEKFIVSSDKAVVKVGKINMAKVLVFRGSYYYNHGDYPKALSNYQKALKLHEELKDKLTMTKVLGNIGTTYFSQADYLKALESYFNALKLSEELANSGDTVLSKYGKTAVGRHLSNIGNVYRDQGDYPKALNHYLKALKIAEKNKNNETKATALNCVGNVYLDMYNNAKALEFYLEYLKLSEQLENKQFQATALANIGSVYGNQGDSAFEKGNSSFAIQDKYPKALTYFLLALKKHEDAGDNNVVAINLANIGSLYSKVKKYKEAFHYLYQGLAVSDDVNAIYCYQTLSVLYETSDVPIADTIGGKLLNREEMRLRALYYLKRATALRDTIFSEENKKQLVRKEMNYEFEKKELIAKAEQDKKDAMAAEELKAKEQQRNYFIAGFALVALLALFILRGYRQKQKANIIITQQKHLVDEKQKEILDSIHYAQRIQNALITSEKYFDKTIERLSKQ